MRRNPNFDVVRALLALWIVALHCLWFSGISGGFWAWSGRVTVDGFIVLSGYVISKLLLVKREPYLAFVYRRFMRLFPAFAACLVIALLLRPWTVGTSASEFTREAAENLFFWPQLAAHVSMMFGLVPPIVLPASDIAFLPTAWSISLEMQLYLAAPLLLWCLRRFRLRALAAIGAVSAAALVPQIAWRLHDYVSPMGGFLPQKLIYFLIGVVICVACRPTWEAETAPVKLVRFPGAEWLASVGKISYSLYLIHYPIVHLLAAQLPVSYPPWTTAALLFAAGLPTSLLASGLLYRWIELPGISLGKRL